jgi:CheY-like chemotaxis protein
MTTVQPKAAHVILVVEDEVLVRMAIAEYLRDCGHKVFEAGTGDEAVRILSSPAAVEIVFSDVQMPGETDGFALAQWVRRERPGVKVVLTSGVARAVEAAGHMCDDGPLICKPYEPAQVEHHIRRLLAAADRADKLNEQGRRA